MSLAAKNAFGYSWFAIEVLWSVISSKDNMYLEKS